jgi:hypothetical protein
MGAVPRPRCAPLLIGALVLVVAAGACSSSKGPGPDFTSTTTAATTSSQPTPPSVPISIPASTDDTSPDGSGCTPPAGDKLPDGIWFGVLKSVDASTGTIGLDLACWFSGTAAQAASGSATPVDDDYYVRNENPKIYSLPTATQVAVVPLATDASGGFSGGTAKAATGVASAQTILASQTPRYVWVEITDGLVTVIQAQFTP